MKRNVVKEKKPCKKSCSILFHEKEWEYGCDDVGHYLCNTNWCNEPTKNLYLKHCKDDKCKRKCYEGFKGDSCVERIIPHVVKCPISYGNQCYVTKNDGCYNYSCELTDDEKKLLKNNNITEKDTDCVEIGNSVVCQCQGKECKNIYNISCYESPNSDLGILKRCNFLTEQCLTAMNMNRVVFRKCGLMKESEKEKENNYTRTNICNSSGCNNEFYCNRMPKSQSWTLIDAELNPLRFQLEEFDEYFFQKLSLIIGNNNDRYVVSEDIDEKNTFIQIRFDKPFLIEVSRTRNENVETKTWIKKNPAEAVTHFAFFAESDIQIWRILARGWNMDNSNFEQYRLIHKSKADSFESASCAKTTLLVQFSLTSSNIAENYKFVFKSTTAIATVLVKFNEMVIDFSSGPLTHHITIKENNYDFYLFYNKTAVMFAYDDNFREFLLNGFQPTKIIFDSNNDDRYDLTIYDYQRPNATCDFNCDDYV
uniref:EGF-like domain-containing protein n=1 Tax=Panagrolaimus sp. JU765 TaxID=591449 RepID=A0AC34RHD9_9BILA